MQIENMDVQQVLDTIAQFNVPGWTNLTVDQVKVFPIGKGFLNTTLQAERVNFDEKQSEGPKCLVYKKYGGNVFTERAQEIGINSPLTQSLIFHEQSKRGWGPKLYGIFDQGRVEEFVNCHTLTAEEAFTPEMCEEVAKAYARFHSHDLPLKKHPRDIFVELAGKINSPKDSLLEWLETGEMDQSQLAKYPIDELLNFPFQSEWLWVLSVKEKITQRIVLCALDSNYLNRLVRSEGTIGQNESRVLIIDHDASGYAHRGYDLAGHFINRMFDVSNDDDVVTGLPFPSEEERKLFLKTYLQECSKQFADFDPDSLDSLEQLTLEVDVHCCVFSATSIFFCSEWLKLAKHKPQMPLLIRPILKMYKEAKENVQRKYPHLLE